MRGANGGPGFFGARKVRVFFSSTAQEEKPHVSFEIAIERLAQGPLALSLRQREAASSLSQGRHDGPSSKGAAPYRQSDAPSA